VTCTAGRTRSDVLPAELRLQNFIRPEQFPYQCKTGWIYDSGDYERAMRQALEMADTKSFAVSRRRSVSGMRG